MRTIYTHGSSKGFSSKFTENYYDKYLKKLMGYHGSNVITIITTKMRTLVQVHQWIMILATSIQNEK